MVVTPAHLRAIRIAVTTTALVAVAGCDPAASPHLSSTPGSYVSEDADGTAVLDHPITRKTHYPPGWSEFSTGERWEFCFDQANGAWTCVPVSAEDFQRYAVGDRVVLRQRIGQLAVIANH